MKVYHSLEEVPYHERTVLTIGTFDGIHRGHRMIIDKLTESARRIGGRSLVLTFDPHPQEVLRKTGNSIPILTTIDERRAELERLGVDALVIQPFTTGFASTPWEDFCLLLIRQVGICHMIVGHDHAFGKNREGNAESLRRFGQDHGFEVTEIGPLVVDEEVISSTKIRRALLEGHLETANSYLGRLYSIRGEVVRGDGRGRRIGVPTANIRPLKGTKLIPCNGVYCVHIRIGNETHRGMANIGVRPTFTSGEERTIEANIFDFGDEIYHQIVTVEFIKFVRSEQKFGSLDEFLAQLERDRAICTSTTV